VSFFRLTPLLLLAFISAAHAQRGPEGNKPLVYNEVSEASKAIEREAKKAYAGKFRFIDIEQKDGSFSSGGVKGFEGIFGDPRSMRDYEKRGKVEFAFIVTSDGRVIEPLILHSTDAVVSKYIIDRISYRRYFPARLHGTPVFSLHTDKWKFRGPDTSSKASGDGLGFYHSRDR
jgi:hypothetical protein